MKVAFIHYHLKTGGVTTVLRRQLEVLQGRCETLVLTGIRPDAPFPAPVKVIEDLGYDTPLRPPDAPEQTARAVLQAIFEHFGSPCDILHVHNPTLAKKRNFLSILDYLQNSGSRLFLQVHDFAEDGRPQAFYTEPYPADCHYGVINSRDFRILARSGLKPEGLHLIPNMVSGYRFDPLKTDSKDLVLYPVRAIRRKNVGEALLLSCYFRDGETLAITQPPNSPADYPSYDDWKTFVEEHRLGVQFEAGLKQEFDELVRTARFLITTSITEGFGFSYLEPWLGGKILWGRKLTDICSDFETKGIYLDHLYRRLRVPLEWIGSVELFGRWRDCIRQNAARFETTIADEVIRETFHEITSDGCIDFGLLDERYQKQLIGLILGDRASARHLIALNPFLSSPGAVDSPGPLIAGNRQRVAALYGKDRYETALLRLYERIRNTDVRHRIDKRILLSHYMNLKDFSLLKWCPYAS